MRHHRIPKYLQVSTADVIPVKSFFQEGRVNTLAEIRDMAMSRSVYLVGLDVEGQEGVSNGVNSVGVAACAAPDTRLLTNSSSHTEEPVDLSDIMKRYEIDAHVLGCASRREKAGFEKFPFGEVRQVGKDRLEANLLDWLNARLGKNQTSGQVAGAILVTWGCQSEFHAMATSFPRFARCFSHWIDVSDVILGAMAAGSKRPSLRDTMLSMGFVRRYVQSSWRQHHSPGMDAARVLGVLIQLWSNPPGWQIKVSPFRMLERERRRIWSQKPPPSIFPFMVRITIKQEKAGQIAFLPSELEFGERLFNFLEKNVAMPLAVAVCERKNRKADGLGSARKCNIGYACFANEATVALFLKWDGRDIGGKTLLLNNVSLVPGQKA